MRPSFLACASVSLVAFGAGCSANVVATAAEADAESSPAAAMIVVERTTGDNAHAEAVARFVRGRTGPLDDQALKQLGFEADIPALGTCARVAPQVPTMPVGGVRLLDVGRVTLSVDSAPAREPQATELVRRRVPDVVDVVTGVVYTASQIELPARGSFEVRVVGEPELGAVRAQADFAGEPSQLRVQGQDVSAGVVLLSAENGVDLSWDTGGERELVYVDVTANEPDRKTTLTRCAFADIGRAFIPTSAFGDADGTLSVHRLHRSGFRAAGIDRGELRLDFAREVIFALRGPSARR